MTRKQGEALWEALSSWWMLNHARHGRAHVLKVLMSTDAESDLSAIEGDAALEAMEADQ